MHMAHIPTSHTCNGEACMAGRWAERATEVQLTHCSSPGLLQACIVLAETRHTWPHARRPPKTFRYMASFAPPYGSMCYCIQYISHKQQLKAGKVCLVHSLRQHSPSQQGQYDHRIRRQSVTCPQSGSRGMAFFFSLILRPQATGGCQPHSEWVSSLS